MSFNQSISFRPLVQNRCGAYCMICLRPTASEEIKEEVHGDKNYARVLVRCHGSEELRTFEFGSKEWDSTDLKRAMQRCAWFDPMSHNETAGIPNKGVINDEGDL
jgi:hypothetical protein